MDVWLAVLIIAVVLIVVYGVIAALGSDSRAMLKFGGLEFGARSGAKRSAHVRGVRSRNGSVSAKAEGGNATIRRADAEGDIRAEAGHVETDPKE